MQGRTSRLDSSGYEHVPNANLRKLFEFHRSRRSRGNSSKPPGREREERKPMAPRSFPPHPRPQFSTPPLHSDFPYQDRIRHRPRPCPTPFPPREKRKAFNDREPIIWHNGNRVKFIDRHNQCGLDVQKCKIETEAAPVYCVDRRTLNRWFNRLEKEINWSQATNHSKHGEKMQPRLSCWVSKCECKYFYGSTIARRKEYPDVLEEIERVVFEGLGFPTPPDSCFLNFYRSEEDCIGWHQDDEDLFDGRNASICVLSLSLGATRDFQIRLNSGAGDADQSTVHSFALANGDLACMSGFFQKFYKHRVPPATTDKPEYLGPRISLTWRWIVNHNCALNQY